MGSYRTYYSLVKLQPWFLSLQWKTCLGQNTDDIYMGAKGDWDFRISDLVKNPYGTDI